MNNYSPKKDANFNLEDMEIADIAKYMKTYKFNDEEIRIWKGNYF